MKRSCVAMLLVLSGCVDPDRIFLLPSDDMVGTPAEFGAEHEEVRIPREDGGWTRAWWIPREGAAAAVVIFGGNMGNRSHNLTFARIAWEAGFHVLLPDYQGFGPDNGERDLTALKKDADAAIAWASLRSPKIGVWGISLGSAVALGAAARRPDRVDALCIEGSFRLQPAMTVFLRQSLPLALAAPLAVLVRAIVLDRDSDPELTINRRSPQCPVFFVHGDRDRLTRTEWAAQLFDLARGPKEMWLMENTGHAPEPVRSQDGEYAEQVSRFFRRALLRDLQPQAGAVWQARRVPDGWDIEAGVVCLGPFPAPVEVVAVAGDEVARVRLWMNSREATVILHTRARPDAVSARRYVRVSLADRPWCQDLTPVAVAYRRLRDLQRRPGDPGLLTLEVPPVLAPHLAAALFAAAQDAAEPEALLARAVAVAPEIPEAHFVVGDAGYFRASLWTRDAVRARARDLLRERGRDAAAFGE